MPTVSQLLSAAQELERANRLPEAEALCVQALELEPANSAVHARLGAILKSQDRLDDAANCYRRVLELNPRSAEAHYFLAEIQFRQSQVGEAIESLRRSIALEPKMPVLHTMLGDLLTDQARFAEAADAYRQAVALEPNSADAHNDLGSVLASLTRFESAIDSFRRAIELAPEHVAAHENLGASLAALGQFDPAIISLRRSIELQPDNSEAYNHLGTVYGDQGRFDDALASYEQALALRPDFAEAHHDRALTLLRMGRFAEGWDEYEWRWRCKGATEPQFDEPRWKGVAEPNARVLIHAEQGFGDTLQFIRYAQLVKARCKTVIVECQPALASLLARFDFVDQVVARGAARPEFDFQVPLLSLPGIFGTTLDKIPGGEGYLSPSPELIERWRVALGDAPGLKIGIVWQGNQDQPRDRFRSVPFEHMAPLARLDGVRCYSLQLGPAREQLRSLDDAARVRDLSDELNDFHTTAAILRNLDLLVSCDSAPLHLAGALGVPAWGALSYAADWRWLLERSDSPWYQSLRLFRQPRSGDWQSVFAEITAELMNLASGRSCP